MYRPSRFLFVLLIVLPFFTSGQFSADACPPNIGFELGTFDKWQCYTGKIDVSGAIDVANSGPVGGRHTMMKNAPPFSKDQYGGFPTSCPNGSGYSIMLGNGTAGAQAERVSYTFKIPDNENDFIIIYNYAVVFQNPNHAEFEQPAFSTAVFDETTNESIGCASFEFVASGNLPGFKKSDIGADVFYKTWSPVTIKLYGYAGKTIRLEFTTNDCTKGGHFGYAYVDVNENCSSLIGGNVFCNGNADMTLTAPTGFMEYHWYDANFSQILGTTNTLNLNPPPPPNTVYALEIVPFPGYGCLDTLYTTVVHSADGFTFKLLDSVEGCPSTGLDLTKPEVTLGSTDSLKFSYYLDKLQNEYVPQPKFIEKSGVYFIKAENKVGCFEMKPINVVIKPTPTLTITNPPKLCSPGVIDITNKEYVKGSDPTLTYTYWMDEETIKPVPDPKHITTSGTYYVKGVNFGGCTNIKPMKVEVATFNVTTFTNCEKADLTSNTFITLDATNDFTYTYWMDANATIPVSNPAAVTTSGTYYVKGTIAASGCSIIRPLTTNVYPYPAVTFIQPATVVYPKTIDLAETVSTSSNSLQFAYWNNPAHTSVVTNPHSIYQPGTYYVQVKNSFGCALEFAAEVKIDPPPLPKINARNIFSPNDDGINDVFMVDIEGVVEVTKFQVFNRYNELIFSSRDITNNWNGKVDGKPVPVGTYYWLLEGTDIYRKNKFTKTGFVTVVR